MSGHRYWILFGVSGLGKGIAGVGEICELVRMSSFFSRRHFLSTLAALGATRLLPGQQEPDSVFTCSRTMERVSSDSFFNGSLSIVKDGNGAKLSGEMMYHAIKGEPTEGALTWKQWSEQTGAEIPEEVEDAADYEAWFEKEVVIGGMIFKFEGVEESECVTIGSVLGNASTCFLRPQAVSLSVAARYVAPEVNLAQTRMVVRVNNQGVKAFPTVLQGFRFEGDASPLIGYGVLHVEGQESCELLKELAEYGEFELVWMDEFGNELSCCRFSLFSFNERVEEASELAVELYSDAKVGVCNSGEELDCYLTTATVLSMGLADDSWELQRLRRFRDEVLMGKESGEALVREYYEVAPRIVSEISARKDSRLLWVAAYWLGILPTCFLAEARLDRAAVFWYRSMTACLLRLGRKGSSCRSLI